MTIEEAESLRRGMGSPEEIKDAYADVVRCAVCRTVHNGVNPCWIQVRDKTWLEDRCPECNKFTRHEQLNK